MAQSANNLGRVTPPQILYSLLREFVPGHPEPYFPYQGRVQSKLMSVLPQTLQLGSYFDTTVQITVPHQTGANMGATAAVSVYFTPNDVNLTSAQWPTTIPLNAGQQVHILVSVNLQTAPVSNLVLQPAIVLPLVPAAPTQAGNTWLYNGPQTLQNVGASISVPWYTTGAISATNLTYGVQAHLVGIQQQP